MNDFDGDFGFTDNAALDTKPATDTRILVDQRRKNRMRAIAFAQAIIDGYCRVDERTNAVAHLTAHTFEGDTKLLVDECGAHAYVGWGGDGLERTGWACGNAGKITAKAASLITEIKGWCPDAESTHFPCRD